MPSNTAPEVTVTEISFSQRIEPTSLTIFGTLGLFSKGPVNEKTQVNSQAELEEIFGKPSSFTAFYYYPIYTILELAPVYIVRVEEGTLHCAGSTFGVSGSQTMTLDTPVHVDAYPLTYDTLFPSEIDITTLGFTHSISVLSIGPGELYEDVSYRTVNYSDYPKLQDLQLDISEANTPTQLQAVGETAYNLSVSGSGISFELIEELVNPSDSYAINDSLLDTLLADEHGLANSKEFIFYEFQGGVLKNYYKVSTDPDAKDAFGKSMWANTVINDTSNNLKVFVGTTKATSSTVTPVSVGNTYLGGADTLSTSISGLIDEMYENLNDNFLSKEETADLTALVDLDFPLAIKQKMDSIASTRRDTVAILNIDSSKMISLTTGEKTTNTTTLVKNYVDNDLNIDSSYSAIYANTFEVYDAANDEYVWTPCTGHVANRVAYTFDNFAEWFAVAGFERGVLPSGIRRVAYNPNEMQRKVLYPARINPIVDFKGEGIVIFGQKTLQSFASNTDRLNVRNLYIKIAKDVSRFARVFLFAQNDALTRAQFRSQANQYLSGIKARRGISEYQVVCDESINTQSVIARNEFVAYLLIRPINSIEFIRLTIMDVGGTVTFSEVLAGLNNV